jgi:hypothetical protein
MDASEFDSFVAAERKKKRLPAAPAALTAGEVVRSVQLDERQASALLRVAAQRAVGLVRPTKHTEVVWVEGNSELVVSLVDLQLKVADGLLRVRVPVRCDQVKGAVVEVVFAVGTAGAPAGLFASTYRRPSGPAAVVDAWGEALVAFAWQCVLGLVSGVAGAVGKDDRGNVLVPVELTASARGLEIVPMARHRFAGSSGLGAKIRPGRSR